MYMKKTAKVDKDVRIKTSFEKKTVPTTAFEVDFQGQQEENLVTLKQEIQNEPGTCRSTTCIATRRK